ncbi:hypothetical protein FM996_05250 [Methylosinus sporium]|uniref:DUF2946 domain-containing protein n=1 Tax=Methylosinus sporium TaxID=428 RepID=A0A549T389_METSR|nr:MULTISPECIES: hypothetical protein [Methylosinus]MBU3887105.1 hypothetical protein [Methylosinus sp. KRF6]TRL36331.1 hypothetical protein FM996_05250 [Methylosinus sporium]
MRAIIARVLACVFVLQGVAFAVSPAHERGDLGGAEPGAVATVGYEYCGASPHGDHKAPAHSVHSQCCILCPSSAHDGLSRFAAVLFDIIVFPPLRTAAAIDWRAFVDPVAPPTGWTSSWSSRAPPSIS